MIRSVQFRTHSKGDPERSASRVPIATSFNVLREAGRRVSLDCADGLCSPPMLKAAEDAGVPLCAFHPNTGAQDIAAPYSPRRDLAELQATSILEEAPPYDFYWELWGSDRNARGCGAIPE